MDLDGKRFVREQQLEQQGWFWGGRGVALKPDLSDSGSARLQTAPRAEIVGSPGFA
jgi:hypothetical protein